MRTAEFFAFIKERWSIYTRRAAGERKPWTKDPSLQKYRFCNVHRECDKVTVWIADNWRYPHRKDPDLWFSMTVARFLNKPSTLEFLGYPVPWVPYKFKAQLEEAPRPLFSAAYMVRSDPGDKVVYLADKVLTPLWKDRASIRPRSGDTLSNFYWRLAPYYGMGSFMIAQIIADTKFVEPLKSAADWWSWAAPGPGSQRGLNRVFGGEPNKPWKGNSWATALQMLQVEIDPLCKAAKIPRISAQDLQNCLCEFDKYERVRLGEGRPKQLYNGLQ